MNKYLTLTLILGLFACDSDENQADKTLVFINDGTIQCETSGLSASETKKQLTDVGISVHQSSCAYISGIAIAAQCGVGTNNINIHLIPEQQVIDAENIGFERVSNLENSKNSGYELIECAKP